MPRNSSGLYYTLAGTDGEPGRTIESAKYNANVHDVEQDLNTPRPVIAGGTGATKVEDAARNLKSETAWQKVTSYDDTMLLPGSFFSDAAAIGAAPVDKHSFAGIIYSADALPAVVTDPLPQNNMVQEARDLGTGKNYVRIKTAGKWGAWTSDLTDDYADKTYVNVSGDTMTGIHTLSANPAGKMDAVTKQYVDGGAGVTDAAKVVHYDYAQTLTVGEQKQARDNIAAAPGDYYAGSLAYNGLQINGAMEVSQEFGASGVPVINFGKYIVDGWMCHTVGSALQVMCAQIDCVAAGLPLTGFVKCLQVTTTLSKNTLAAGDMVMLMHQIEGWRIARLGFGTAGAFPVEIGFWVLAKQIGKYSGAVRNGGSRSYPFEFNIDVTYKWEYKSIVVPGDVTGTWARDTAAGMQVCIAIGLGTDWTGPKEVWAAANLLGANGTVNGVSNSDDTVFFTGFHVIPGDQHVLPEHSSFVSKPIDAELAQCRRYYYKRPINLIGYAQAASIPQGQWLPHPVGMRVAPAMVASGGTFINAASPITIDHITTDGARTYLINPAAGASYADEVSVTADARLP
jgi:hypothetical protein